MAQAQQQFEEATLVSHNALKQLMKVNSQIKQSKNEIPMFDTKYKGMIDMIQSKEQGNFTNEVKNLTSLKQGLYKEYRRSVAVRDELQAKYTKAI